MLHEPVLAPRAATAATETTALPVLQPRNSDHVLFPPVRVVLYCSLTAAFDDCTEHPSLLGATYLCTQAHISRAAVATVAAALPYLCFSNERRRP